MNATEFKELYPEFAAVTDLRVDAMLVDALDELGSIWDAYPIRKERAQGLLAAHILLGSDRGSGSAAGPVTAESVGDLSRSYGSSGMYKSNLGASWYGQEFDRLMRKTVPSIACLS